MAKITCSVCYGSGRSGGGRCYTCKGHGTLIVSENHPIVLHQKRLAEEAKKKELDQQEKLAETPQDPKE